MSAKCQKQTYAPQQLTSYPAQHPRDVVVIDRPELATHFCFFKGNVDPTGSSEQGYGRPKHWPRADPDCDAKGKNNEAQVHWIAGKLIRTTCNKLDLASSSRPRALERRSGQISLALGVVPLFSFGDIGARRIRGRPAPGWPWDSSTAPRCP
jgi:hypothetical protein